jgi:ligand-binding sensor domain-containing protein/signal transduction histidine kinase
VRTADRQNGGATGVAFFRRLNKLRLSRVSLVLLACCRIAFALNPSLDISQYAHKAWTVREGFFNAIINTIAQTPDGYLWLGTDFGLLRFDGVRPAPLQLPAGEHLPSGRIMSLLTARDGRLWIGTSAGLVSWKDNKLTRYPEFSGQDVDPLLEDRDGTVWAGAQAISEKRLCAIRSGGVRCYGEDGRFGGVYSLCEDGRGNLWAGALTGLWRWNPSPPKRYAMPDPEIRALIEDENGALLIALRSGVTRFVDGEARAYPLPGAGRFKPTHLLRDRNGGLWIGTQERGLVHVHKGRTDLFAQSDGLSGDFVASLFEDREGNIWVATSDGLDRFRDFAVPRISVKQGLSNANVTSVLADRDGSVWLGTFDGLNKWNDGEITIYRKRTSGLPDDALGSLFQDDRGQIWAATPRGVAHLENGRFIPVSDAAGVHTMAEDTIGNLWISGQNEGLFRLLGGRVVEQIPWARLRPKDFAYAMLPDTAQGGLWLGFYEGGVAYFNNGQIRASYTTANGLGEGIVNALRLDQGGALWAATEGGLSRVKNGRVVTLTGKNGLPCDAVHWTMEDDDHSFWLSMACGLVRIARPELDAWVMSPKRTIQTTVFDSSDGVRNFAFAAGSSPQVARSKDGRLWFLPLDGVSVLDPHHLPVNKLPPPVHIEQITADRKTYDASSKLRLPALTRDLEIDYTALSLVAPEKNRFRVKLEGRDPDWKDVGNERKAFYNDLPPRNYRFRVIASNNSGVWNETGDSQDFSIAPAYYQTRWFQAACVAVFLTLLWGLHRYRLHQIAREFNVQLEARVNERTRVARDLHDTLLQSFQGLILRFQSARNQLPANPAKAAQTLDSAIDQAAQAVTEGRDAVQGLRSSTVETNDLALAIGTLGEELASKDPESSPELSVEVEGASRDLHPILRDEVYRIASEALRNAFRHAQARRIQVGIRYDERQLRLRVRDDGKGIDPKVLDEGRSGHFGLPGMRERAELIRGRLTVESELESGTEVELTVPAAVAYAKARRFRFFLK